MKTNWPLMLIFAVAGCAKTGPAPTTIFGKNIAIAWPATPSVGPDDPQDSFPKIHSAMASMNEPDGMVVFQLTVMAFQPDPEFDAQKGQLVDSFLAATKRHERSRTEFRHDGGRFDGVKIDAQPDGKKTRNVCLLSGPILISASATVSGDKTLTDPRVDAFLNSLTIDGDRIADSMK
jgi:hypothetical protein